MRLFFFSQRLFAVHAHFGRAGPTWTEVTLSELKRFFWGCCQFFHRESLANISIRKDTLELSRNVVIVRYLRLIANLASATIHCVHSKY